LVRVEHDRFVTIVDRSRLEFDWPEGRAGHRPNAREMSGFGRRLGRPAGGHVE
jgi:hypothetical protein